LLEVGLMGFGAGIGVAFLIYDHVITFRREYDLVWRAPASTSKYAFLVNRYIVPAAMIPVLWGMQVGPLARG
jgi:hypothetical protein